MSNENIEKMKKIIEEKKKVSAQQGFHDDKLNKQKSGFKNAFKTIKRGGSLNK